MIHALAPPLRKAGYGRIVHITSIDGIRGKFGQTNCCTTNTGLIGLTDIPVAATPRTASSGSRLPL